MTISHKNALSRLHALQHYYRKRVKFTFSDEDFIRFVQNNHITEYDRIRLNKNAGNVGLGDLWISRNSTRIKRRRNAE